MKILPEMYLWTRKSPLNFGRHPDLDADQGVGTNFGVGRRGEVRRAESGSGVPGEGHPALPAN